MKKLFLIVLFFIISNYAYANGKILKSGFITKSASVEEGMKINDPKNKIIIIYNHGQNRNDKAIKKECIWINQIMNQASLVEEEINGKKIMGYNFCSNDFAGDMSLQKGWNFKTIYEGKHKLDKRIEKNLELIDLTGAGDLFAAGYLHGYLNNFSPIECLEKGKEMSSRVIQQIGARL